MKFILPILLFISTTSSAQSADFIILKKHNKTVQTFYSGTNIAFTTESGSYINALINGIKNDTLYLQEFIIRYLPTTIGTYIIDTAGSYHYKYHYTQIMAIGKKEKTNFNTRGSGVSHVGVYLGNNKFIHASVSKGVMVNGLFEPYYLQRFYGAGRITEKQIVAN